MQILKKERVLVAVAKKKADMEIRWKLTEKQLQAHVQIPWTYILIYNLDLVDQIRMWSQKIRQTVQQKFIKQVVNQ